MLLPSPIRCFTPPRPRHLLFQQRRICIAIPFNSCPALATCHASIYQRICHCHRWQGQSSYPTRVRVDRQDIATEHTPHPQRLEARQSSSRRWGENLSQFQFCRLRFKFEDRHELSARARGSSFPLNALFFINCSSARDKGTAQMLTGFAAATIIKLKCIQRLDEILNLTAEMHIPGWTETRLKSILGDNWLHLLGRF